MCLKADAAAVICLSSFAAPALPRERERGTRRRRLERSNINLLKKHRISRPNFISQSNKAAKQRERERERERRRPDYHSLCLPFASAGGIRLARSDKMQNPLKFITVARPTPSAFHFLQILFCQCLIIDINIAACKSKSISSILLADSHSFVEPQRIILFSGTKTRKEANKASCIPSAEKREVSPSLKARHMPSSDCNERSALCIRQRSIFFVCTRLQT
jgi:hypothetical protein